LHTNRLASLGVRNNRYTKPFADVSSNQGCSAAGTQGNAFPQFFNAFVYSVMKVNAALNIDSKMSLKCC